MQTYEIVVRNRSVSPNSQDMTLVRTSVGVDRLHVLFADDEWLDFPVTVTFANGDAIVTQTLVLSSLADSSEYVAESYVGIPSEVTRSIGQVRVTLQGTDANGNHIITAKMAPLSVEESGDVDDGEEPEDAPSASEWRQAYAEAMVAVNQAASLVQSLQGQIDAMVAAARSSLDTAIEEAFVPATKDTLGTVIVGDGLGVAQSGELYVSVLPGITASERAQLANLAALAYYCFDTEFDEDGNLLPTAKVKASAMPKATPASPGAVIPDGLSIGVTGDGVIGVLQ